jgi:tRNA-Thr(GGU) m(6)t(6)A37 methyltransferase TsaA
VEKIVFTPVGYVKTDAVSGQIKDATAVSQIVLQSQLIKALDGIAGFSHLFVLFHLNQVSKEKTLPLKIHPKRRADLPLTGIFATRTMLRPNPIGLTIVELLKVDSNVLTVRGLDAFDGTPILDIKPFDPWDIPQCARAPQWWKKLYET